jgi:hypothetical protein
MRRDVDPGAVLRRHVTLSVERQLRRHVRVAGRHVGSTRLNRRITSSSGAADVEVVSSPQKLPLHHRQSRSIEAGQGGEEADGINGLSVSFSEGLPLHC